MACARALWGEDYIGNWDGVPAAISLSLAAKQQLTLQLKNAIAARMNLRAELAAMQAELKGKGWLTDTPVLEPWKGNSAEDVRP